MHKLIFLLILLIFMCSNLNGGVDPRQIKFELLKAVDNCEVEKIQSIVDKDTLKLLEKTGNSIENLSVLVLNRCKSDEFCKILPHLIQNNTDLNKSISSGETILHEAIRHSKIETVRCLLENGADQNIRIKIGKRRGKSPVQLAKRLRKREIYAVLTAKEDASTSIEQSIKIDKIEDFKNHYQKQVNQKSKDKLLIEAAKNGSLKISKFLLEQGANPNHIEKFGNSAYFHAVSYADTKILKLLLENKLDVNAQNSNNNGPIAWIFESSQPVSLVDQGKTAKLLIENGLKKEACEKGFKYYKGRYGVYTKDNAIEHDRHLESTSYVYTYDMLASCKIPK